MKANNPMTDQQTRTSSTRVRRSAAGAIVGLLALSACTSDPGPRRVALDIIEAEAVRNPDVDEDCLLEEMEDFSDGDLKEIAELLDDNDADDRAEGEASLAAFDAALGRCS